MWRCFIPLLPTLAWWVHHLFQFFSIRDGSKFMGYPAGPGPSTGGEDFFTEKFENPRFHFSKKAIFEDQSYVWLGKWFECIDRFYDWHYIRLFLEEIKKGAESLFRNKKGRRLFSTEKRGRRLFSTKKMGRRLFFPKPSLGTRLILTDPLDILIPGQGS